LVGGIVSWVQTEKRAESKLGELVSIERNVWNTFTLFLEKNVVSPTFLGKE